MPSLKVRARTMLEIADGALFLFAMPEQMDSKARELIDGAPEGLLLEMTESLALLPEWTMESLESHLRSAAENRELGLGKVAQPLRAALTGRAVSPGIFDVLFLLGREESLQRLRSTLTA